MQATSETGGVTLVRPKLTLLGRSSVVMTSDRKDAVSANTAMPVVPIRGQRAVREGAGQVVRADCPPRELIENVPAKCWPTSPPTCVAPEMLVAETSRNALIGVTRAAAIWVIEIATSVPANVVPSVSPVAVIVLAPEVWPNVMMVSALATVPGPERRRRWPHRGGCAYGCPFATPGWGAI